MDEIGDPQDRARGEVPDDSLERPFYIEGPRVMVWIACPEIRRVFVHFNGVRTVECLKTRAAPYCKWCTRRDPRKVQDWLWVLNPAERAPVPHLCCLTTRASEMGPLSLWDAQGHLLGRSVWLWRDGGHRNDPIGAELVPNDHAAYDSTPAVMPEVPDPIIVLRRMWAARLRADRRSSTT